MVECLLSFSLGRGDFENIESEFWERWWAAGWLGERREIDLYFWGWGGECLGAKECSALAIWGREDG